MIQESVLAAPASQTFDQNSGRMLCQNPILESFSVYLTLKQLLAVATEEDKACEEHEGTCDDDGGVGAQSDEDAGEKGTRGKGKRVD